jgi:hypothetical protein
MFDFAKPPRSLAALTPPFSLGLSALVAGVAVFLTDMDLDVLGYSLLSLAVLLLLHAGLSAGYATPDEKDEDVAPWDAGPDRQRRATEQAE